MRPDAFGSFHPAVTFFWFIGAIVLVVVVENPLWLACAFIGAAAYYLSLTGRSGIKMVLALIPLFIVLSFVNGFFNPRGETVLFTYFNRRFTLEAVICATQTAAMFACVLMLFGSYNRVMTSDKFTYLFGGVAPSITLVLTMILRLVPDYIRKAGQIAHARDCIGRGAAEGSVIDRARHGIDVISALTSWALEAGIVTADSMRSRGYGCGRRTQFATYRFRLSDGCMLGLLVLIVIGVAIALFSASVTVEYFPTVVFPPVTPLALIGFCCFGALMVTPIVSDLWERMLWRSLLYKI